jgi:hypothetical protein
MPREYLKRAAAVSAVLLAIRKQRESPRDFRVADHPHGPPLVLRITPHRPLNEHKKFAVNAPPAFKQLCHHRETEGRGECVPELFGPGLI